jgi:hypothetical protein
VKENCPFTCGMCCTDDLRFEVSIKNATSYRSCSWIHTTLENRRVYCNTNTVDGRTVKDHCPESCNYCSPISNDAPSSSPTISNQPTSGVYSKEWQQIGDDIFSGFFHVVNLSAFGKTVAISDLHAGNGTGSVTVMKWTGSAWTQLGNKFNQSKLAFLSADGKFIAFRDIGEEFYSYYHDSDEYIIYSYLLLE